MSDEHFGRYRLVRRLGGGGMADVFRAELVGAEGVTRELVVKKVLPGLSLEPEAVAMFVEEARIAARLHHPNVVQVYEFGRAGDGYFLAMELVEGCDLAAILREGGAPPRALAWVFSELLEALGYVHAMKGSGGKALGLVHRDVSPHNVLLGTEGEVKLADFGIAMVTVGTAADEGVKGKYAYMAPEQARGEAVDARTDLFAVGAMLFQCFTGQRLHDARGSRETLDEVREGRHADIESAAPTLHPSLAAVVKRALCTEIEGRFTDARSFREALMAAFAESGVTPERGALRELVQRYRERVDAANDRPVADRTLTVPEVEAAPDHTATNDFSEKSDGNASSKTETKSYGHIPTVRSASRVFIERVGIALGVFTLAVLAERRTRPGPGAGAMVRVALPDDPTLTRWFDGTGRALAEHACRCRVTLRSYRTESELRRWLSTGAVEMAAVASTVLPALRAERAIGRQDGDESEGEIVVRPELMRALGQAEIGPGGWMFPVALGALVCGGRLEAPGECQGDVRGWVVARRAERTSVRQVMHVWTSPLMLGALAGAWRAVPVRMDVPVVADGQTLRAIQQEAATLRGSGFVLRSSASVFIPDASAVEP